MKVLLTHSYFMKLDPKQVAHAQPYAPLGTMLAAACLRERGHRVWLHDTMFSDDPEEIVPLLDQVRPDILVIYDDGFNYLTKMCLVNMRQAALKMQEFAKQRGCMVVVNSSDAADHYEMYLMNDADFVIIGEGEKTLVELLDNLKDSRSWSQIAGLAYQNNGTVTKTGARKVMRDLDTLPLPAWDLIDFNPYRRVWKDRQGYISINIATTRGCPYKCNWCAKPIYGNNYTMRSPESVIKELLMLKERFGFDHVWFCDDIFGLKRSWVTRFADLVQEHKLRFRFKIQSRADLLVQAQYVSDLARAGCSEVWMGAESGSQKILDAMDKGTTVSQIREARSLLKNYGIRAAFFLQFGYPGETEEDIQRTISLVKETMPEDIGISVSYPLPGTVFYDRVRTQLGVKQNWNDSDELALMFRNTFSPKYYRTLHRFVHSVFRSRQAASRVRESETLGVKLRAAGSFVKHSIRGQFHRAQLLRNKRPHA